jgi:hypothetical protein
MFRFQFCWSVESRGHRQATAGNTIIRSGRVEFQIAASSEVLTAYRHHGRSGKPTRLVVSK